MLYYTQLIFIKDNQEQAFNLFEDKVLPLLKKYNGELIYRTQLDKKLVIESSIGNPDELHIITFATKEDFNAYKNDKERLQYLHLKETSVAKAILLEGVLL
ncbi:MAG: hypothetical protein ABI367_07865 [Mucilaginibacter sp.]